MTTFLLIRHASHDFLGKRLAGRSEGVCLNERGSLEAQRLVERLASHPIHFLYASPRERTRQTAAPLASVSGFEVTTHQGIDEIDFGDWTGKAFSELEHDPEWPVWVNRRSAARPPNGETITAVQERAVRAIEDLAVEHPERSLALFSHGDVIKSVLANYLRTPLDELESFEISPASVSVLLVGDGWSRVTLVNDTGGFSTD